MARKMKKAKPTNKVSKNDMVNESEEENEEIFEDEDDDLELNQKQQAVQKPLSHKRKRIQIKKQSEDEDNQDEEDDEEKEEEKEQKNNKHAQKASKSKPTVQNVTAESNLRRSSRSTRNQSKMIDDYAAELKQNIKGIDEGFDESDSEEEEEVINQKVNGRRNSSSVVQKRGKFDKMKVNNSKQQKNNNQKKKKEDDDDQFECDLESEDSGEEESDSSESDESFNAGEEEDNTNGKRKQQHRQFNASINLSTNENSQNDFTDLLENKDYNFKTSQSRTADQILRQQVLIKQKKKEMRDETEEKYSDDEQAEEDENGMSENKKSASKRSREEFEQTIKESFILQPDLNKNTWPKYVGTIQFKAKIQFEIFGYMRKVEFIQMKRWATRVAEGIKRGDPLDVDFRPIDDKRGTNRTLSLQTARLHTNIALKGQTFGVFEHDFCEIWNFLAHKNYITLKLFCANGHDFDNRMDENKAFDVIMDVYINQNFVRNPIYQSDKIFNKEDDEIIDQNQQQSDEKKKEAQNKNKNKSSSTEKNNKQKQDKKKRGSKSSDDENSGEDSQSEEDDQVEEEEDVQAEGQKGKKKVKKLMKNMDNKELEKEWDLDYIKYMKEVIPLFINLMKLKTTIPSLIKQKNKNQFQIMKSIAVRRGHATHAPQFILKSEEMREYYSHAPEVQEKATPLYLLTQKNSEQTKKGDKKGNKNQKGAAAKGQKKNVKKEKDEESGDDEQKYNDIDLDYDFELNENTRQSLGLVANNGSQNQELNEDEALKLNEKFNNTHESKYYYQSQTPPNMCTELFDYQKQGLSWLLYREGRLSKKELFQDHPEHFDEDRELSSFYEEVQLPDGYKFYHNVFSGQISHKFVSAKHTFGGILADQMGLGKTLMSLALMHSDMEERRKQKMYGTLLVLPLTCLSQWLREITNHSTNDTVKVLNYHEKESRDLNLTEYDIVVIPYNLLASEHQDNPNGKLFTQKWRRVILDEAQKIKNRKSTVSLACYKLQADYRWALTGTPIENKLDVETFGEWFWWNSYINNNVSSADQFDLLHQVLKPLILRRTKQSRDKDGNDILELPPKNIYLDKVKLNKSEQKLYDLLHNKSKTVFNELNKDSKAQRNYIHIFQIIIKLRQFCVHPSLVFKDIDEKKIKNVNQLTQKIEEFLDKYKQLAIKPNDQDNKEGIDKKNKNNQKEKIVKITEGYKKELIQQINNGEYHTCLICFEEISVHTISVCGHILCNSCFRESVKLRKSCPICRSDLLETDLFEVIMNIDESSNDMENEDKYDFKNPYKLIGSKVKRILEIIKDIHKKNEKVVVFTQWLGMLNILDEHLIQNDIQFERIDGSVKTQDKDRILRRFEKDNTKSMREEDVTVLLASIKSASVGLNLVAANHVILCDPWWNPAVEDQAMERVHRIGQTKEVHVWRVICANTIEEKVIELHDKKRVMISNALACTDNQRKEGAINDIQFLLN